ncbi:hypothetical protein [Flavobacterium polysaccharolyticum]|uniref:Kelch motif-containing protein n=1 Tax=Flavobacterium polysaccharolyticum TaxID=3133148 RepID=A0ABU9NLG9_9FLAO
MNYLKVVFPFFFLIITSCQNEPIDNNAALDPTSVFQSGLVFKKVIDIPDNYFVDQMPGFTAHPKENVLYLSCRDKFISNTETIYKINVSNQKLTIKNSAVSDFATKRNHIFEDKLYVLGGEKFNRYGLDLTEETKGSRYGSFITPKIFSRFGTCISDSDVYIIGGFLGGETTSEPNYDRKIWKLNLIKNTFDFVDNMPKNRNGGSSEYIKGTIYTFFGYENVKSMNSSPAIKLLNDIQVYDLSSKSFLSIPYDRQVRVSFTAKYNHYIFVAGNTTADSYESPVNGSFMGYFDTKTNKMTEIKTIIEGNTYDFSFICEIEIMNDKVYALVRNSENSFSIQVANLK